MPRTRSRISFSADFASSWATATITRPSSISPRSSFSRAEPRLAASATSRCWAPSWRSRSMRRRSVSALSTAAVRLVSSRVTWAAWTWLGVRPEQRPGQRQLDVGDADGDPRGDDDQADDPDDGGQRGAAAGGQLEEVELRRLAGQLVDVGRHEHHRQRPAPRHHRQHEADDGDGEAGDVVGDLLPPGRRPDPLPQPPQRAPGASAAGPDRGTARPSARRSATARRGPSPRDTTNSSQANGSANTNVISRPAVVASSAMVIANVMAATGRAVRT